MASTITQENCFERFAKIEDQSLDCIITDPPYNASETAITEHEIGRFHDRMAFQRFYGDWDVGFDWMRFIHTAWRVLKPGGWLIVFNGDNMFGCFHDVAKWYKTAMRSYLDFYELTGILQPSEYHNAVQRLDSVEWKPWFEYKATVAWHKTNPVTRVRQTTTVSSNEWIQICRRTNNGKSAQPVAWNYLKHNEMHNLIKGDDVDSDYFEGGLCGGHERLYWHALNPVMENGEIVGGEIVPCLNRSKCDLCKKDVERRRHGTQKPLYTWQWIYERYTKPGLKVYDPFAGTASSGVAAAPYDLDWFGSELSWEYVQVAQMNLNGVWRKAREREKQMEMF